MHRYFRTLQVVISTLFLIACLPLLYHGLLRHVEPVTGTNLNNEVDFEYSNIEKSAKYAKSLVWSNQPQRFLKYRPSKSSKWRILHIINPYRSAQVADTQKVTMASIEIARKATESTLNSIDVDVAVAFILTEADRISQSVYVPDAFYVSPVHLNESDVVDSAGKKLPILRRLLEISYSIADEFNFTHVVFTNRDILVMPSFYFDVAFILNGEKETFFINRVEIPEAKVASNMLKSFFSMTNSSLLYERPLQSFDLTNMHIPFEYAISFGQHHPGFDCVVIKKSTLKRVFPLIGDVFVGYPPAGSILNQAIASIARREAVTMTHMHSTFHIGSRNSKWGHSKTKHATHLPELNQALASRSEVMKKNGNSRMPSSSRRNLLRQVNCKVHSMASTKICPPRFDFLFFISLLLYVYTSIVTELSLWRQMAGLLPTINTYSTPIISHNVKAV